MKQHKKIWSVLLALVLVCSLLPFGAAARAEEPESFSITVVGGTAYDYESGSPITQAAPDTLVYVEAEIPEGQYLAGWTAEPEDLQINPDGSFNMPAANVTLTAVFAQQQSVTVDLTEGSETITDKDVLDGFLRYWDEEDFADGDERSYDLDGDGKDDVKVSFHITETPDPEDPDKVTKEYSAEFEALGTTELSGEYKLISEEEPYAFTFLFPEETYTVSFDPNGGGGSMDPMTVKKGDKLTLPENGFTPPANREFDKWDAGAPGEEIDVTGDMVIKAIWKEKAPETCTVSFDPNGGTGSMNPVTIKKGGKLTLPDSGFTPPEGMEFDQWDVGEPGEKIEVTGDMVLRAMWKWKTYKVSFYTDGGSAVAAQTIQHGEKALKPADPTKDGYVFKGWFTDPECKTAFDFETPITADIVLYAKWEEEVVYTITEGHNKNWTKGSIATVKIVVKRSPDDEKCYDHFANVLIDNKLLEVDKDYTAEAGSTVITLKPNALDRFSTGSHAVLIQFDDGEVGTRLIIRAGAGGPRTGDESVDLWVVLLAVSGLALAGGAYYGIRRHRKSKEDETE